MRPSPARNMMTPTTNPATAVMSTPWSEAGHRTNLFKYVIHVCTKNSEVNFPAFSYRSVSMLYIG